MAPTSQKKKLKLIEFKPAPQIRETLEISQASAYQEKSIRQWAGAQAGVKKATGPGLSGLNSLQGVNSANPPSHLIACSWHEESESSLEGIPGM